MDLLKLYNDNLASFKLQLFTKLWNIIFLTNADNKSSLNVWISLNCKHTKQNDFPIIVSIHLFQLYKELFSNQLSSLIITKALCNKRVQFKRTSNTLHLLPGNTERSHNDDSPKLSIMRCTNMVQQIPTTPNYYIIASLRNNNYRDLQISNNPLEYIY